MTPKQEAALKLALKRAFYLGQTYWQQADSEYTSQWKKADVTLASFNQLIENTIREALADNALDKMAENAKELGLDYEPAQQEPVAWMSTHRLEDLQQGFTVTTTLTKIKAFEDDTALYTSPQPAQQQEPVAWVETREDGSIYWGCETDAVISDDPSWLDRPVPVYFGSSGKPWVGLTQRDINIAFDDTQEGGGFDEFARAIEAKLREKNA